MEHQASSVDKFEKFTWTIKNFSNLDKTEYIYSEPFVLGGYHWRIFTYPLENNEYDYLTIFLEAVEMKTHDQYEVWNRDVEFNLTVFNQLNTNRSITSEGHRVDFDANYSSWGSDSFMPLFKFHDPEEGFIVKDVCIIGVELFVRGQTLLENQVNQEASLAWHTNLEDRTNDLQGLLEELKKYRFDLAWLDPHVQSALEIRSYVENALQVEKLKEKMVALELETDKLKTKLTGISGIGCWSIRPLIKYVLISYLLHFIFRRTV